MPVLSRHPRQQAHALCLVLKQSIVCGQCLTGAGGLLRQTCGVDLDELASWCLAPRSEAVHVDQVLQAAVHTSTHDSMSPKSQGLA